VNPHCHTSSEGTCRLLWGSWSGKRDQDPKRGLRNRNGARLGAHELTLRHGAQPGGPPQAGKANALVPAVAALLPIPGI
jgi:hypothetical protein